ncbi:MAG: hypothetical protein QF371_04505 [Flavobacteriales bacterium]|nr:hypothetical protein [Flavobacteriales bacterium]
MNKLNSTRINFKVVALIHVMLLGTFVGYAQDDKFGANPDKCKENISLYREYYKQKNYDDAMMGWRWAFANCPMATKNIVINGPKMIKHLVKKNEADAALKKAYIDTLMIVYDRRIELYPTDKAYALGRKGMDQYDYAEEDYIVAYNTLLEAVDAGKNETDPYVLMRLYQAGMKRLIAKQIEMDVMYDLYDKVSAIIDHQLKQFEPGTTEEDKKFKKVKKAEGVINQNFERIAKEDQYVALMEPKVDAEKENEGLLTKVVSMMTKRKWTGSTLYLKASELLYKIKPSTTAAYGLYEGHAKKGNDATATKYLEESIKLETDNVEKADKLLKLAKVYGAQKKYGTARTKAKAAAGLRSGWGEPYLYIGDIYLSTSSSCGDNTCSKKYGIWAAEDMYLKARSVDAGVSEAAGKKIATCKKYYPIKKDCFFINLESGATVTVGGWIGAETTARFAD